MLLLCAAVRARLPRLLRASFALIGSATESKMRHCRSSINVTAQLDGPGSFTVTSIELRTPALVRWPRTLTPACLRRASPVVPTRRSLCVACTAGLHIPARVRSSQPQLLLLRRTRSRYRMLTAGCSRAQAGHPLHVLWCARRPRL